jgi:hypothetical protein
MISTQSTKTVVAALLLIGTIASIALVGPAAAQLDGTETKFYNDTIEIGNTTTEITTTVNGTNGSDVYVNYYRIETDTNSTEHLETEGVILSSDTGNETSHTYAVQTENTSAYRVVVHDNGDGLNASEVGSIAVTDGSGSGGGILYTDDGSPNLRVIFLVIAGISVIVLGVDD